MGVMFSAFVFAILVAVGAGFALNAEFQVKADERFVGSGALLRPNEAGYNLVGKQWTGLNAPGQKD